MYMCMEEFTPQQAHRGQRSTLGTQLSPSSVGSEDQIPEVRFVQQGPLSAESSHGPQLIF